MTGRPRIAHYCATHRSSHVNYHDPDCKLLTPPQERMLSRIRRGPALFNDRKVLTLKALEATGLIVVNWDSRPQTKGNGMELVGENTACAKRTARIGCGQLYPNSILRLEKDAIEGALKGSGYKIIFPERGYWIIEGTDKADVRHGAIRSTVTLDAVFERLAELGISAEETTK